MRYSQVIFTCCFAFAVTSGFSNAESLPEKRKLGNKIDVHNPDFGKNQVHEHGRIGEVIDYINVKLNSQVPGFGTEFKKRIESDLNSGRVVMRDTGPSGGNYFRSEEVYVSGGDLGKSYVMAIDHSVGKNQMTHFVALTYQRIVNQMQIDHYNQQVEKRPYKKRAAREKIEELQGYLIRGYQKRDLILEKSELDLIFEHLATAFYDQMTGLSINQILLKAGVSHPDNNLKNNSALAFQVAQTHVFEGAGLGSVGFGGLQPQVDSRTGRVLKKQTTAGSNSIEMNLLKAIKESDGSYEDYMRLLKRSETKEQYLRAFARANQLRVFGITDRRQGPVRARRFEEEPFINDSLHWPPEPRARNRRKPAFRKSGRVDWEQRRSSPHGGGHVVFVPEDSLEYPLLRKSRIGQ